MQLLRVDRQTSLASVPETLIVCHDVRNPAARSEVLVRKGSPLEVEALRDLLMRGVGELHLAAPAADDFLDIVGRCFLVRRNEERNFGEVLIQQAEHRASDI